MCVCVSQKKDRPFFWGEGDGLTVLHTDDDRCALWQPSFLRKYRLNEFLTNSSPLLEIHISNELCIWREGEGRDVRVDEEVLYRRIFWWFLKVFREFLSSSISLWKFILQVNQRIQRRENTVLDRFK